MTSSCDESAPPLEGGAAAGPRRATSYSRSAMSGSAWAIGQVVLSKGLSVVGAVVTSWLLLPEDLGLAALTLAAITFAMIVRPNVLADILVRDVESSVAYARAARRLTVITTIATVVLTIAMAPLAVAVYGEGELLWLVPVGASRVIAGAIGIDALARLRLQFRFREIAAGAALESAVLHVSTIAMAASGLGPFSIILGQSLGIAASGLRYRMLAPPEPPTGRERPMRELMRPFALLNAAQSIHTLTIVSATLCLAFVLDPIAVGLFSFASAMAAQVNMLLAYNVGLVLQPIFGHLQSDPERQTAGFTRACAAISALAVPAYLAQAAVARPLLELVFAERWLPSLGALEILLVAQCFAFATGPAMALMKSRAHYGTLVMWQLVQVIFVAAAMILLSSAFGLLGAAVAILLQQAIFGPMGVVLATRAAEVPKRRVLRIFLLPLVLGMVSFGPPWLLVRALDPSPILSAALLVGVPIVGGAVYLVLARRIDPAMAEECRRVLALVRERLGARRRGALGGGLS